MAETKSDPASYDGIANDAQLLAKPLNAEYYRKVRSAAIVEKTRAALEEKKFAVEVVNTKEEALAAVQRQLDPSKSFYMTASHSISEIGFTDWIKANPGAVRRNFKAEAAAAMAKGDWAASGEAYTGGASADVVVTSPVAVTEDGSFLVADGSGSRTSCWALTGGKLVVLVGANKIEPNLDAARKRLDEWTFPLVDAWVRVAFAAMGAKGSQITNVVEVRGVNPFGANRLHVIMVNDMIGF